eukprot:546954_1
MPVESITNKTLKWNDNDSTIKHNDFQFSWTIADIDQSNNNDVSWQYDESTEISNDFSAIFTSNSKLSQSKSEPNPLFVGLQIKPKPQTHSIINDISNLRSFHTDNISNDNKHKENEDWYFNLVCIYIEQIPINKQTIIPIEVIQMCYTFIDKNAKCLIDLLTDKEMMKKCLTAINYDYQQNVSITIDKNVIIQAYKMINNIHKAECYVNEWKSFTKDSIDMLKFKSKKKAKICLLEQYHKLIPHLTQFSNTGNWLKEETSLIHALSG